MMRITLTASAGVLLEADGLRFLVDALHGEGNYPFSRVPETLLAEMDTGASRFSNADYVLFTHDHPDHYTPRVVERYLRHNSVRRVLLPKVQWEDREGDLLRLLQTEKIPWWRLGMARGTVHSYQLQPGVFVRAVGMQHTGARFADADCDCTILQVNGKNFLFTSDCDYMHREAYAFAAGQPWEAVFVNPFFYHSPQGQALLRSELWAKHIFVYHVPFAGEDPMGLRALVHQDRAKLTAALPQTVFLTEPMQEFAWE